MIYEPNQCPIRFGLGAFGDRWSLLIIRDMMFRGHTRFQQFLDAGEGIATNVLSDRLRRLEAEHIISREKDPANGRQVVYRLTEKGDDLLPIMLAITGWAHRHDPQTSVPSALAKQIETDRYGARDTMTTTLKRSQSSS
ncbi:MAG: helix-turn-helix transcriptional regulator [Gammaproteobacteria bacterium]|nr:helix-turn-helix transcriptional regulator [Gammaproteobacteria bacterium]